MATEHLIRRNPFLSTLPECFDLLVWHCGRRSGWKEGLRVLATNGSQEFRRQRRLRVCMLGDVDRIGRRNPSCVSRQEASCRRYKVVPIIGLKITRVELATEKLIESLPCCKKIENFLLPFFFPCLYFYMCARVTETIWYVSDCCQLNCDSESSRSAPWALPPFVFPRVACLSLCAK